MFQRARLRLTLLYLGLMGITLALVAGGILILGAQQARRTEDQSLRLRAESLASTVQVSSQPQRGGSPPSGFRDQHPRPASPEPNDEEVLRLEREGILAYLVFVEGGSVPTFETTTGLPSAGAAQSAVSAGKGRYSSMSLDAGDVRVYSLPVVREGSVVAVVQVAKSPYFVNQTVTRLLLVIVAVGAAGLALSAITAFLLAGRTLRPIAGALQRQRDFTADASHELRTPLALLRGNAELMQRHPDERIGAYSDVVQDIVDETDRLTRLVTDLLTLARADSGRVQLAREAVDLSALATDLARDLQPLAASKHLALRSEVALSVVVRGDADRLRQLSLALLDNAIRYTRSGEIVLRLAVEGRDAMLSVTDTGIGIAPEHLPRVFERFYRADAARTLEAGGAGLGLSIANWIAEAHAGRISAKSAPGEGSTFTVRLPLAEGQQVSTLATETSRSRP